MNTKTITRTLTLLCFIFSTYFLSAQIVISELSYNPCTPALGQGDDGDCEFMEIHNQGASTVDISGYNFDDPTFTFPAGTMIAADEYILIVINATNYPTCGYTTPGATQIFEWTGGVLGNGGESVNLFDASATLVDAFTYDDGACGADGDCNSLQYTGTGDNMDCTTGNWIAATPTPGAANNTAPTCAITNVFINNVMCTGADLTFDVNYTAANGSGTYEVVDNGTSTVLASGATSPITVTIVGNTSTTAFDVVVWDQVDNTCVSDPETVNPLDCSVVPACPTPGDLIITEIMHTPAAVGSEGEYVEIYNTTAAPIDLQNYVLKDDGGNTHTIALSVVVPAMGYAVLGADANMATNGGYTADYQYSSFFLSATDEVVLECTGTVIDSVDYGTALGFPAATGASISLDPNFYNQTDNDNGANWCVSSTTTGLSGGDLGTPGNVNVCNAATCPGVGDLVINEIMQNPDMVGDNVGEWFEIYNPTGAAIDMFGFTIRDNGANAFTVTSSVVVPAGGYAVFGKDANSATNGGYTPDFVYSTGMDLSNGDDEIILECGGVIIDSVYWDGGPNYPDPTGASMSLNPATADASSNDTGSNWCEATSAMSGGDLGTPGAANDACGTVCPPDYAGANQLIGTETATADYETDGIIESIQLIDATAIVDYDSAIEINLLPGFETVLGAMFHAFIDGCAGAAVIDDNPNAAKQQNDTTIEEENSEKE